MQVNETLETLPKLDTPVFDSKKRYLVQNISKFDALSVLAATACTDIFRYKYFVV